MFDRWTAWFDAQLSNFGRYGEAWTTRPCKGGESMGEQFEKAVASGGRRMDFWGSTMIFPPFRTIGDDWRRLCDMIIRWCYDVLSTGSWLGQHGQRILIWSNTMEFTDPSESKGESWFLYIPFQWWFNGDLWCFNGDLNPDLHNGIQWGFMVFYHLAN